MMPHDLPLWKAVYKRKQRWISAGVLETTCSDVRVFLRRIKGLSDHPSAVILDARVVQSTPESSARAGYRGHKRRSGSKVHITVDALGHLLAPVTSAANEDKHTFIADLAEQLQQAPVKLVSLAYFNHRYKSERAEQGATAHGI